jgi:hypothetical protein
MEEAATLTIFQCSQQEIYVREILANSGSEAKKSVVYSKPYNGKQIVKLECVGHVQEGMGTMKETYGSKEFADGKSIKNRGKLTVAVI